jgi:mannose-6-phosphate isomerase
VTIAKLVGTIQNYAWGSRDQLAKLLRKPGPSELPEAELWFGAHPMAPSSIDHDGARRGLDALIASSSSAQLGDRAFERFGRLPFLLKILAVEQPLSIQAHPSAEQALEGFQRERAQGILPNDANANYRDDWPKPELLCPLTEFEAMCGFRPVGEIVQSFETLGGDCFLSAAQTLKNQSETAALHDVVSTWLEARGEVKSALILSGLSACALASKGRGVVADDARLALALAAKNPDDAGVLVALLMRRLTLKPGEGLFVPAGVVHAYLRGLAVEVMASSDNVLRGGLTQKHVDVAELLRLVSFGSDSPQIVALAETNDLERFFDFDVAEFRVSHIGVEPNRHWCSSFRQGPEMLLCVRGNLRLMSPSTPALDLQSGECAWVCADEDVYCAAGQGIAYRVQVGD